MKISAVINTLNEEKNIKKCLGSVKWTDEIVVVDMESEDKTAQIAQDFGAKVFTHKKTGYVEPARNFAIEKAEGPWILLLDADEILPETLKEKLREIVQRDETDFVRLPRKNIIFGKWVKHSGWWPDFKIRFFKKGQVVWSEEIHSIPLTYGKGKDLTPEEDDAIIHYNYESISQFVGRLNRYSSIQAAELKKGGYQFFWPDLIRKPANEFLSRFFAQEGYKDGLLGFALSLLQAFSTSCLYLKIWESDGFREPQIINFLARTNEEFKKVCRDFRFWVYTVKIEESKNLLKKFLFQVFRKFFK